MKKVIDIILIVMLGVSLSGCEWFEHNGGFKKRPNPEMNEKSKFLLNILKNGVEGVEIAEVWMYDADTVIGGIKATAVRYTIENDNLPFKILPEQHSEERRSGAVDYYKNVLWGTDTFRIFYSDYFCPTVSPKKNKVLPEECFVITQIHEYKDEDENEDYWELWLVRREDGSYLKQNVQLTKYSPQYIEEMWKNGECDTVFGTHLSFQNPEYPRMYAHYDGLLYDAENNFKCVGVYEREVLSRYRKLNADLDLRIISIKKSDVDETDYSKDNFFYGRIMSFISGNIVYGVLGTETEKLSTCFFPYEDRKSGFNEGF